MLEVGFTELKLNYKRLASDLGDNPFDTLGVLALVESAQSKQTHLVTLGILMDFKGLLMHRFSKFIKDQVGLFCVFFLLHVSNLLIDSSNRYCNVKIPLQGSRRLGLLFQTR